MTAWWRKKFRLASVTGVGDAPSGWALVEGNEIRVFYRERDREKAKHDTKHANQRGYL